MENIYLDGQYLAAHPTWDAEDSPWKAGQVAKMLERHSLRPASVVEIGCGAGGIVRELSERYPGTKFYGYDISPQAIALANETPSRVTFRAEDPLDSSERFDLLLALDVFEHVPDYIGFLEKCHRKASYQIYHIPLDLHVSGLLRDAYMGMRRQFGHLHYFSEASALATLSDTGHEIVDYFYTSGAVELFRKHPSLKRALANGPRWLISRFSTSLAAKLLGGFSLMVLCR